LKFTVTSLSGQTELGRTAGVPVTPALARFIIMMIIESLWQLSPLFS
jgi:hypothetical protein